MRPNVLLCLVTLLVVGAVLTMLQPEHFGTVYRTVPDGRVRGRAVAADALVGSA